MILGDLGADVIKVDRLQAIRFTVFTGPIRPPAAANGIWRST